MQSNLGETEPLGLATLDEKGKAPEERIKGPERCRELVEKLVENDEQRNIFDTRIKGMIAGNPPYRASLLKKSAQAWRTNINWGEGKSMIQGAMVPYYDLLAGSQYYCGVSLNNPDRFLAAHKSRVVTEKFDEMLKSDDCFEHELMLAMNDRLRFGRGMLMWDDDYDPFFTWVNRFSVHVPDRAKSLVDDLVVMVIEQDIPVDELYEYSKGGESGWDKDECFSAIRRAESPSRRHDENRQDLEQQRIIDKDILDGMSANAVRAAHVLVKEFNDTISHYIIERDGEKEPASTSKPKGYLYKKVGRWDDWKSVVWVSFHEITDGSWNGASGMGRDILPQVEIKNRVKCTTVDLGFLRSSVSLRATTDAAYSKAAIIQNGPVNVYPPGLEPMPVATYVGDIDSMMNLDWNIEQTLGRNTGIYRQLPEKANGNPLSATGEILRNQQSATLSNSAVTRFYSDLDRLYREMYRRAVEGPDAVHEDKVKKFRQACMDEGVTIEELRDFRYVRAYRTAGNGSIVMRQQSLAQLGAIAPLLPPKGQQEWVRDSISGLTNVETADRYWPVNQMDEVTLDHSIAALENDSLSHGSPVQFAPNQNHVIHAQVHLQVAAQALASVEQGGDPIQVLASLEGLMPHTDQHIQFLEGNKARANEAKLLRGQWNQIAKISDDLRDQVQQMQEQAAQQQAAMQKAQSIQQGVDPETQIKIAETQQKLQLAQMRTAEMMRMKAERHAQDMKIASDKHAQDLAINDATTAAAIQRSTAETISAINSQRAKTASEVANKEKKEAAPA